jgi:hypothetical protein
MLSLANLSITGVFTCGLPVNPKSPYPWSSVMMRITLGRVSIWEKHKFEVNSKVIKNKNDRFIKVVLGFNYNFTKTGGNILKYR